MTRTIRTVAAAAAAVILAGAIFPPGAGTNPAHEERLAKLERQMLLLIPAEPPGVVEDLAKLKTQYARIKDRVEAVEGGIVDLRTEIRRMPAGPPVTAPAPATTGPAPGGTPDTPGTPGTPDTPTTPTPTPTPPPPPTVPTITAGSGSYEHGHRTHHAAVENWCDSNNERPFAIVYGNAHGRETPLDAWCLFIYQTGGWAWHPAPPPGTPRGWAWLAACTRTNPPGSTSYDTRPAATREAAETAALAALSASCGLETLGTSYGQVRP